MLLKPTKKSIWIFFFAVAIASITVACILPYIITLPLWIPPVIAGVSLVACIVGAILLFSSINDKAKKERGIIKDLKTAQNTYSDTVDRVIDEKTSILEKIKEAEMRISTLCKEVMILRGRISTKPIEKSVNLDAEALEFLEIGTSYRSLFNNYPTRNIESRLSKNADSVYIDCNELNEHHGKVHEISTTYLDRLEGQVRDWEHLHRYFTELRAIKNQDNSSVAFGL